LEAKYQILSNKIVQRRRKWDFWRISTLA